MSENKEKISISIDAELLRRIDAVCEDRNEARSSFFERLSRNEIAGEESFVANMESPIWRALITTLTKSPAVMKTIANVVGEEFSEEDAERVSKNVPELTRLGRERAEAKRQRGRANPTPKEA